MQDELRFAGAWLTIASNTNFSRLPTRQPGQWLYLLGDEGVVYSEGQNRFAGLDAAGVFAYRAFDAGVRLEDLRLRGDAHSLVQAPAVGATDALHAIYLLSQGIFPAEDAPAEWPAFDPSTDTMPAIASIEIHGIPISLEYPQESLGYLCREYFKNCTPTTRPDRCHLSVQREEEGWTVSVNGRRFFSLQREEQVGLGLMHAARSLLYAEGEYDIAFHAAMVAHGDSGVMLCAQREFGKSTLAAYLVTQGFDLLTDEPALLNLSTSSVAPLPLPISLKEGSWPILLPEWPQLAYAPIHVRSDGTKIRLAHAPAIRYCDQPRRLTHIVFPQYCQNSTTQVEPLLPLQTLHLLNEGGMLLSKGFVRDDFEAFLMLISQIPAYKFRYSLLEDTKQLLYAVGDLEIS